MPEGDTVYLTAKRQHSALAGRRLTRCDIRVPRFATVDLAGELVHSAVPRGKHLFHRVGGFSLHSHLKMEGVWLLFRTGERWRRPAHQARVVLEAGEVQSAGFQLGSLEVIPTADEQRAVGHLGPDVLGPDWDAEAAASRLGATGEVPVFAALLDQRNLAGLGNVYANELCFVRGLLPTRDVRAAGDLALLAETARRMLWANKDRTARSTTGDLRPGQRLWVYGRAGEPCRRCGTRLEHGRLGARAGQEREVTWCPHCQR